MIGARWFWRPSTGVIVFVGRCHVIADSDAQFTIQIQILIVRPCVWYDDEQN